MTPRPRRGEGGGVMPLSKPCREALKPYADLILKMESMVRESTPVELALLSEACMMVTQTDRGWPEYRAVQVIRDEILSFIRSASEAE